MDRIKSMSVQKGLTLSVNKKQKRKGDLVNELINLEIPI